MKKKLLSVVLCAMTVGAGAQVNEAPTNASSTAHRNGAFTTAVSPMDEGATDAEMRAFSLSVPACGYFVFTENRDNDIRLTDRFPTCWLNRQATQRTVFTAKARLGEYFIFQLGLYAPTLQLKHPSIRFTDMESTQGPAIAAMGMTCFNLGGMNDRGEAFQKNLTLHAACVQPLWIGAEIPQKAKGHYRGRLTLSFDNAPSQGIDVELDVSGKVVKENGCETGASKSRLSWLNSRIAQSDEPTHPYVPLTWEGNTIHYLGGEMTLGTNGMPETIATHYNQSIEADAQSSNAILAQPVRFILEENGNQHLFTASKIRIVSRNEGKIVWEAMQTEPQYVITCTGTFHFDGQAEYDLAVKARESIHIEDIRMEVPMTAYASKYMMGLNHFGGLRKNDTNWTWDINNHQDQVWLGNVNAGLNLCLKDENYQRPLVNIYYTLGKLELPVSWGNGQKGGIRITTQPDSSVVLKAYSGPRNMSAGSTLHYDFSMMITPVKPLDYSIPRKERFYHSNSDVSSAYLAEALKGGANAINIHHKKDVYPFINYPYYDESAGSLKAFIDKAHQKDVKVRVYYTTRELTVKTPEFWALRSLGSEVFHDGPGSETRTLIHPKGPNQWLNDHLKDHFIPAWYTAFNEGPYKGQKDLSVITAPDSRWNNYYLEGLNFLVKHIGIDGIYIDDSALDRLTLQRARRILDQDSRTRHIDLHSWNHFNQYAGYANSVQLYMEQFPYIDRLWLGEGFGANMSPDSWLVEVSGIPFGLPSETLDEHNIYRGMVFNMLPRLPWSGNPTSMWHFEDSLKWGEAKMLGFWNEKCPVKTSHPDTRCTVYQWKDKAVIVLANWNNKDVTTDVTIDVKHLGFQPSHYSLPYIEGVQESAQLSSVSGLTVPGGKGAFILVK